MYLDQIENKEWTIKTINDLAAEVTCAIAKYEKLLQKHLDTQRPSETFKCPCCSAKIEPLEVGLKAPFTFEDWEDILEENDPLTEISRQVARKVLKMIHNLQPLQPKRKVIICTPKKLYSL